MQKEIVLKGGRTTRGVVRIAATVYRPTGSHSVFVHRLLLHLAANRFSGSPKFLGVDSQGREMLSYIEGNVPSELGHFSDIQLRAASLLIRQFHEITANSSLAQGKQVVCHHDLSPCNFVFWRNRPVVIIDFDSAHPGTRLQDLSYAAWLWLDIGNERYSSQEQIRRMQVFLNGYGQGDYKSLLAGIKCVQQARILEATAQPDKEAFVEWAKGCLNWVISHEK